jgi:hypothetical protein
MDDGGQSSDRSGAWWDGDSVAAGGADYHRCRRTCHEQELDMAKKSRKKKARKKSAANHGKRPNS